MTMECIRACSQYHRQFSSQKVRKVMLWLFKVITLPTEVLLKLDTLPL